MPNTARRFGLIVNETLDQRIDPEKSTWQRLNISGTDRNLRIKSSVMLCMAAYNAGEGRIMNALRK